jgi:hypothetical protein
MVIPMDGYFAITIMQRHHLRDCPFSALKLGESEDCRLNWESWVGEGDGMWDVECGMRNVSAVWEVVWKGLRGR